MPDLALVLHCAPQEHQVRDEEEARDTGGDPPRRREQNPGTDGQQRDHDQRQENALTLLVLEFQSDAVDLGVVPAATGVPQAMASAATSP